MFLLSIVVIVCQSLNGGSQTPSWEKCIFRIPRPCPALYVCLSGPGDLRSKVFFWWVFFNYCLWWKYRRRSLITTANGNYATEPLEIYHHAHLYHRKKFMIEGKLISNHRKSAMQLKNINTIQHTLGHPISTRESKHPHNRKCLIWNISCFMIDFGMLKSL